MEEAQVGGERGGSIHSPCPYPFLSTHPSAVAYIEARYTRLGNGMSFLASRLAVEWGGCPARDVYIKSLLLSLCGPYLMYKSYVILVLGVVTRKMPKPHLDKLLSLFWFDG